tara:strand:- start:54 stop:611 length:558 start_codon:yes stop_codon:yes gene_type:complete
MIITKHIEGKVDKNYFYLEGVFEDINCNYFIKKIKDVTKTDNNENYKTHVKGKMTSWRFFYNDSKFLKLFRELVFYIDHNFDFPKYHLKDAWGYSIEKGEGSHFHHHNPHAWSGAIYLNDHDQALEFPDIRKSFKPKKGGFVLFSSGLTHGCLPHRSKKIKYGLSFNVALDSEGFPLTAVDNKDV